MIWTSEYFTHEEMKCHCGECDGVPRPEFMAKLDAMRGDAGFPFRISSGYRCAEYNETVSGTGKTGPHVQGLAADISVMGVQAFVVLRLAFKFGMTGVGISQKGPIAGRFIHVDSVPLISNYDLRPAVWSY